MRRYRIAARRRHLAAPMRRRAIAARQSNAAAGNRRHGNRRLLVAGWRSRVDAGGADARRHQRVGATERRDCGITPRSRGYAAASNRGTAQRRVVAGFTIALIRVCAREWLRRRGIASTERHHERRRVGASPARMPQRSGGRDLAKAVEQQKTRPVIQPLFNYLTRQRPTGGPMSRGRGAWTIRRGRIAALRRKLEADRPARSNRAHRRGAERIG
jgi:hypothetical protein